MFNVGDRVRYTGNPGDERDFGTVVLTRANGTGLLVEWDNGRYDCPEVAVRDGKSYFGEWFSVRDVVKID